MNLKSLLGICFLGLLFSQTILAQDIARFKSLLLENADQLRKGENYKGSNQFKTYFKINPLKCLEEIKPYETDSTDKVRWFAFEVLNSLGKSVKEQSIRQAVVNRLVAATNDKEPGNRGAVRNYLKKYNKEDFSVLSKNQFIKHENDSRYLQENAKLIGFIDIQELRPELEKTLNDTIFKNERERWPIRTALARLGNDKQISFCVSYAENKVIDDKAVYGLLQDILYIKQPKAIDYLIKILNNDDKNCRPADPDNSTPITCAYRIMEMLAPVIENFPLKTDLTGEIICKDYPEALEVARKWFSENKSYVINRNKY
jgi:hypothetical protein